MDALKGEGLMRYVCEKLLKKRLKVNSAVPGTYIQTGRTMVMVESRQWNWCPGT